MFPKAGLTLLCCVVRQCVVCWCAVVPFILKAELRVWNWLHTYIDAASTLCKYAYFIVEETVNHWNCRLYYSDRSHLPSPMHGLPFCTLTTGGHLELQFTECLVVFSMNTRHSRLRWRLWRHLHSYPPHPDGEHKAFYEWDPEDCGYHCSSADCHCGLQLPQWVSNMYT